MKQATKIFGGKTYGKFDAQIKFHNHIICVGLALPAEVFSARRQADKRSFTASPIFLDVFSDLAVNYKVALANIER
jgi:hypothetical protein